MKKVAQIIVGLVIVLAVGHLISSALGCGPTQAACQGGDVRHVEKPNPIDFRP